MKGESIRKGEGACPGTGGNPVRLVVVKNPLADARGTKVEIVAILGREAGKVGADGALSSVPGQVSK